MDTKNGKDSYLNYEFVYLLMNSHELLKDSCLLVMVIHCKKSVVVVYVIF